MTEITIMYFGGCVLGLICGFILGLPIGALMVKKELERKHDKRRKALEQQSCNTPRNDLATTSQDCISREAALGLSSKEYAKEQGE